MSFPSSVRVYEGNPQSACKLGRADTRPLNSPCAGAACVRAGQSRGVGEDLVHPTVQIARGGEGQLHHLPAGENALRGPRCQGD